MAPWLQVRPCDSLVLVRDLCPSGYRPISRTGGAPPSSSTASNTESDEHLPASKRAGVWRAAATAERGRERGGAAPAPAHAPAHASTAERGRERGGAHSHEAVHAARRSHKQQVEQEQQEQEQQEQQEQRQQLGQQPRRRAAAPWSNACRAPAVQISLMAAAPRHPFFRCTLALLVRNVHRRSYGRSALETTGPVAAGRCLGHYHRMLNYSMPAFMAPPSPATAVAGGARLHASKGAAWSQWRAAKQSKLLIYLYKPAQRAGGGKTGGGGRARAVPLVRAHAWSTARAAAASTLAIPEPAPYEEATPLLTDKRGGALGEPLLPYADVWGARRIFRNRSEGCTLRKDTEAVHWRPGSAARLGRYWDMVVPATEEPTSSR